MKVAKNITADKVEVLTYRCNKVLIRLFNYDYHTISKLPYFFHESLLVVERQQP